MLHFHLTNRLKVLNGEDDTNPVHKPGRVFSTIVQNQFIMRIEYRTGAKMTLRFLEDKSECLNVFEERRMVGGQGDGIGF